MLRFFRQFRRRLLTENRFSKYLLYAVGEILLVVVGILIALQIDTWNQHRIQQARLKTLLTEIQNDLLVDIEKSKEVVRDYESQDSILTKILNQQFDSAYLASPRGIYPLYAAINWDGLKLTKDSFQNFILFANEVKLNNPALLNQLKGLYVDLDRDLNISEENTNRLATSHMEHLAEEEAWYAQLLLGNRVPWVQKGYTDYVINNSKFHGRVLNFKLIATYNHLSFVYRFQKQATLLYQALAEEIGGEGTIPTEVKKLFRKVPDSLGNTVSGVYQPRRYSGSPLELKQQGDSLILIRADDKFPVLLRYDGSLYVEDLNSVLHMLPDKSLYAPGSLYGFLIKMN